jgi:hypothetical protein
MTTLLQNIKNSLTNARTMVEQGPEGTVTFVEINSNPMTGVYFVSKKKSAANPEVHDIDMHMIQQPEYYPDSPDDLVDTRNFGFSKYEERCEKNNKEHRFSRFRWKTLFNELIHVIEDTCQEYGGVLCFENGDMTDYGVGNVFVLHFCDILNIFLEQENNRVPELYLKTALLGDLYGATKNMLMDDVLTKNQTKFLVQEADFIYTWFCFYDNKSFVPIRTTVFEDSPRLQESSFFSNNTPFRKHQQGKMKQIYQDRSQFTVNLSLYRTI